MVNFKYSVIRFQAIISGRLIHHVYTGVNILKGYITLLARESLPVADEEASIDHEWLL